MKTNTPPQTLQGKPSAFDKSGILGVFWGPLQFIFACTVVKYCAIALCRSGSKKRPDLFFLQDPMSVSSGKFSISEQIKIQDTRRSKNLFILRKVISRFQISGWKSVRSECYPTIFDPKKSTVSSRSKHFCSREQATPKSNTNGSDSTLPKGKFLRHEELVQKVSLIEQFITRKAFKRF